MGWFIINSLIINIIISFLLRRFTIHKEYRKQALKASIKIAIVASIFSSILTLIFYQAAILNGEEIKTIILVIAPIYSLGIFCNYFGHGISLEEEWMKDRSFYNIHD